MKAKRIRGGTKASAFGFRAEESFANRIIAAANAQTNGNTSALIRLCVDVHLPKLEEKINFSAKDAAPDGSVDNLTKWAVGVAASGESNASEKQSLPAESRPVKGRRRKHS